MATPKIPALLKDEGPSGTLTITPPGDTSQEPASHVTINAVATVTLPATATENHLLALAISYPLDAGAIAQAVLSPGHSTHLALTATVVMPETGELTVNYELMAHPLPSGKWKVLQEGKARYPVQSKGGRKARSPST